MESLIICESNTGQILAVDRDVTVPYVTTSGWFWTPYKGKIQEAKLLRLEVGKTGELIGTPR